MATINITSQSGAVGNGDLQLQNGAPMDATLRLVTDALNTASPLKLSTALVQSTSTVKITTSDVAYIDAEDNSGNNRFTVSRAVASQLVTVDFASVPSSLTTPVGAIRTATDGVNLANVMTFLENGNIGVGTDTPTGTYGKLTVQGTGITLGADGLGKIEIGRYSSIVPNSYIKLGSNSDSLRITNSADQYDIVVIENNTTGEKLRLTQAGNVGIGTTTPSAMLTLNSTTPYIRIERTGVPTWQIQNNTLVSNAGFSINNVTTSTASFFIDGTTNNIGIGTASPTQKLSVIDGSILTSRTDSAENIIISDGTVNSSIQQVTHLYLNSGGNSAVFGDIILRTKNTYTEMARFTQNGLCFNGDTAAANALDDYEEGTWTMGVSFGGNSVGVTYVTNTGTYTKIGRQVTLNGILSLSSKGSSTGTSRITGLPFVIGSTSGNYSAPTLRFNNVTFINQFQGYGAIGDVVIIMEQITNLGATTSLTDTNFANNSDIMVSMTYFV